MTHRRLSLARSPTAVLGAVLAWVAPALAGPIEEGRAAGAAANAAARATINETDAAAVVPGYTASPPQTALYPAPSLAAPAAAAVAACAAAPDDPACEAIVGARASAATPRAPLLPTDAAIVQARAVAAAPEGQGVTLGSVYGGCSTRVELLSPAVHDTQSCHDYLLRVLDRPCTKDRIVTVDWQCPANTVSGPTRHVDPATGKGYWTCVVAVPREETYCVAPLSGPAVSTTPPLAGRDVCVDAAGVETLAPTRIVTDHVTRDATPVVTDAWANGCAGYEARVPAGYLPPDGDNTAPSPLPPLSGPVDKCERRSSICSQPLQTRLVNDLEVTRECWQYSNAFDCVDLDSRSDCGQPRFGVCAPLGEPRCVDADPSFSPPLCTAWRHDFSCRVRDAVHRTIEDCGTQSFCTAGACFEASHPPDADFARTVAYLEASREAGTYLDAAGLRVFRGFDNRCTKKLFGLVNCCNRGGTPAAGLFTNLSIAQSAMGGLGRAATSSYVYDALFVSDAPSFVLTGFEALWGTGFSSGLAGMLAGDLTVSSFLGSLVPGWWTLAVLAIQASGILTCEEAEQVLAMKRDASLCVPLGSYCSRRLPLIRTCLETTETHCCFNSRLARMINEQGLGQVGRGFGSAQSPACSGFSVAELQALDFSRMDLREFYAEIAPTLPDVGTFGAAAAARAPACYHGEGKCP